MSTLMDEIIEEGWFIFQRERDGLPCSIRRARLRIMCQELADGQKPSLLPDDRIRQSDADHWPMPDRQQIAANDDTFDY